MEVKLHEAGGRCKDDYGATVSCDVEGNFLIMASNGVIPDTAGDGEILIVPSPTAAAYAEPSTTATRAPVTNDAKSNLGDLNDGDQSARIGATQGDDQILQLRRRSGSSYLSSQGSMLSSSHRDTSDTTSSSPFHLSASHTDDSDAASIDILAVSDVFLPPPRHQFFVLDPAPSKPDPTMTKGRDGEIEIESMCFLLPGDASGDSGRFARDHQSNTFQAMGFPLDEVDKIDAPDARGGGQGGEALSNGELTDRRLLASSELAGINKEHHASFGESRSQLKGKGGKASPGRDVLKRASASVHHLR